MNTTLITTAPVVSAAMSFFRCARSHARLSAAEVKELFRTRAEAALVGDAKAETAATRRLVCAHLYLVAQVVAGYQGEVDEDELISAGCRALLQAVNGYDAARSSAFAVYATQWVKQAVARAQHRSHRGSAPFNYRAADASRKLRAAAAELSTEAGRPLTPQELAARCGKSAAEVRELLNADLPGYSLQQPLGEDGTATYGDRLADTAAGEVYDALNARQTEETLRHNIRLFLSAEERHVLLRRLGLGADAEEASFESIAAELGISSARAKQLFRAGCRRLRALPALQQLHADLCA